MPSTPGGFVSARSLPPMPYGAMPMLSHMPPYPGRPQSQMVSFRIYIYKLIDYKLITKIIQFNKGYKK